MRRVTSSRPNIYSGGTLDRAAALRADEAWVEAARRDPQSRYVLFREGRALVNAPPDAAPHAAFVPPPDNAAPWVLQCERCGTEHFPRSDPAVIMLVTRGDRLLLGQSHRFPKDMNWFSTLAGFVEPGENLEDAVRREVLEEVGVRVGDVAYHSSQPWPFPASLMLGFYAEGLSEEIVLEAAEMRDARWFTADEIANREALGFNLPPPESIARRLIDDWLA